MSVRVPTWALLLVLGLLVVGSVRWGIAYGAREERIRDLEAQAAISDSVAQALEIARAAEIQRRRAAARADSARRDSLAVLRSEREGLDRDRAATHRAVHAADSSYTALRARVDVPALPTLLRMVLEAADSAVAARERETAACVLTLTNCDRQRELLERQVAARDSTIQADSVIIAGIDGLTSRIRAERDSARALLKPPPPFEWSFSVTVLGPNCNLAGCSYVGAGLSVARFRLPLLP